MISNTRLSCCSNTALFRDRIKEKINKIAFIDFDGTIVDCNSVDYLIVINKYLKNRLSFIFWRSILQIKSPFFYLLNYLSSTYFDKYYYSFFKGLNRNRIDKIIKNNVTPYIKDHVFPQAEDEIQKLHAQGYYVVIVSGSLKNIIKPIALELGADDCIATHLEEDNGCFTGKVKGYYINHLNKRRAIAKYCLYNNYSPEKIIVYGNSKWDIAMFDVADKSYVINPDRKLSKWSKYNQCEQKEWSFEKIPFRFYFLYLFFRPLIKHWQGLNYIPKNKGVIIVANHCSYLDHYVIGLTIMCRYNRRVRFLAKKEHFNSPFQRWIHQLLGAFPIDREKGGKEGLQSVVNLLKQGEIVLLYPEGTRSNDGLLQSFKPGILYTHYNSGCQIIPVGIKGAYDVLPSHNKFPRPGRISLKFGPAISFIKNVGETALPRGNDRNAMLESLRYIVGRLANSAN